MSSYKSPKKPAILSLMDKFLIIFSTVDHLKPWALDSRLLNPSLRVQQADAHAKQR